jgi:hexosaminidase
VQPRTAIALAVVVVMFGVGTAALLTSDGPPMSHPTVVPAPASMTFGEGWFTPASVSGPGAEFASEALHVPVAEKGNVTLDVTGGTGEGYTVSVGSSGIHISAATDAGIFYGVQTLRQLEVDGAFPAVEISDEPRFEYRGAMLDVARHFFSVDDVKTYIDDIALVKINHLHLHLTDDQGWRIEILKWPLLTERGAQTSVNGDGGGFYTQADYSEIVEYAASRFVTIVPEIDMPGHTNAALHAYPELTCDGVAPDAYEGVEVGFSSLCIGSERTYDFVADVLTELAAITPGPYLHIGGDESLSTTDDDFLTFARRVGELGQATGKTLIGWHELGASRDLPEGTVGQYWGFTRPEGDSAAEATTFVERGGRLILSPADVAYLDMKYDPAQPLGLEWAQGPTPVTEASLWDPADIIPGIGDERILGVEAPLWSETITTIEELEFMAFPRLAAIADIAWSRRVDATPIARFDELGPRLVAFTARLDDLGVTYYRAPDLPFE